AAVKRGILCSHFECVVELGFECCGMRGVADFTLIQYQQNGTRRIGSARLITVRIGGVEHRLVGERKLRSPVRNKAASDLFPFLIEHAGYGVAIPSRQQFARYFNEM